MHIERMRQRMAIVSILALAFAADASAGCWQRVTGMSPVASPHVLVAHPSQPGVLYMAGFGVAKSNDHGATWRSLPLASNVIPWALTFDANGMLYVLALAGHDDAILKTATDGVTWQTTKIDSPLSGSAQDLAIDPNDPNVMYVALSGFCLFGCSDGGVIKSTDGGRHWRSVTVPSRVLYGLFHDPVRSNVLYAAAGTDTFRTTDGGATWTGLSLRATRLAIDPSTPGTVYASNGYDPYVSRDDGTSWRALDPPISWARTFAFDPRLPGAVCVAGLGGAACTADGGTTWSLMRECFYRPDVSGAVYAEEAYALAMSSNGTLIAGASSGIWSQPATYTIPPSTRRRSTRH